MGPIRRIALMGNFSRDVREGQIVDFDTRDGSRRTWWWRASANCRSLCRRHWLMETATTMTTAGGLWFRATIRWDGLEFWWGGDEKPKEQVLFEEPGGSLGAAWPI